MDIDNSIQLRPAFEKFSTKNIEALKNQFENIKQQSDTYKIRVSGSYIYLAMGLKHREYWSPTLQLELDEYEDGRTHIKGTFGPDPVLWTMFMFLHFVVGGIFLIFAVITFSKWSLGESFKFDLVVMFAMTNIWFLLYFIARLNRKKGSHQAKELYRLMEENT